MDLERRLFLGGALATAAAATAKAQSTSAARAPLSRPGTPVWPGRERFPLWPGSAPGAPASPIVPELTAGSDGQLRLRGIAIPEVHVHRPARPDGSALLVLPGGAYYLLSVQNEGLDAAQRFNTDRMTVFILSYRLPGEGWANRSLVPLSDAQRAMRLIRARAAEFGIDPARLGVMGFSAGGHLAADLTASHAEPAYAPIDAADRQSARPAYSGLIYPVATLDPAITHKGSFENLLGPSPSEVLIAARSPERHLTSATPPVFLVHAFDDGTVPIANSLRWVDAAQAVKVPVEAHLFTQGGHGFGFRLPREQPGSQWPDLFSAWLRKHGG